MTGKDNINHAKRKDEIEVKLEKEQYKLNLLQENTKKCNQITRGIVNILSSFEDRLGKLEATILPVYHETENLQRKQQNIDKTISALDHVISYYSVAEEVDSTVRSGPSAIGLDEFLAVMNKLKDALDYFEKNNPQSVQLENVSSLFNIGTDSLCREFKELLLKHSLPVPAIILLDLVAADDEILGDTDSNSTGSSTGLQMKEGVASDLGTMANWLLKCGRDDSILTTYSKIRGGVMLRSIQHLKDHQRSGSGTSVVCSSSFQTKNDQLGKKTSKRLQAALEKKANKMLLKASQTLESSTGINLGGRRSTHHLETKEDVVEEQEMDSYLLCVMAVQRLMQTERTLMTGIIPISAQNPVFQNIIQRSLDIIVQDGENISQRAKRCILRRDFGSVLIIFPILKHLLALKPEFERAVEGCDYSVRSQYTNIINTLHSTAAKALEEVVESLRCDTSGGLPKDGTVHEITSNILVLIANLVDYRDTIAGVLGQDSTYNGAASALVSVNISRTNALISIYIKKILNELQCTLVNKSEGYSDVGVRALFRLNNCHHVLKALQRSDLQSLIEISEPDCQQTYLDMISNHKKAYQTSWHKVLSYITGTEDIVIIAGRMKDKDRSAIKERFAGFNREMEEIAKLQRSYSIPDVELRESLKRDNKEFILPKYNAFFDKFSSIPFTKNSEKYVKYSPEQVASMIDRFFDVAA